MLELERYELFAGPAYRFEPDTEPDRRDFFKILGGGIVVMFALSEAEAQESGRAGRRGGEGNALPKDIGAWLHIGEYGKITVFTGKVEVGQNSRTSLTQAVSEELCTAPEAIALVMGDTDLTPFDMGTFGSRTTPTMAPQLRRVAAAARELLLDLAAVQWKADRSKLKIENGKVRDPLKGTTAGFGELTKGNNLVKTIDGQAIAKPHSESFPKVDARAMVTGAHRFTSDFRRLGILHGKVLRAPAVNSTLVSVDTKSAGQMTGVQVVRDGDFVGVCGPDPQSLSRALASIKAEWKTEPQPSSQQLFAYLKANPDSDRESRPSVRGAIEEGLSQADHKLEASYTVAYIAHVPLEPRAAVAEWESGKLTVWTGTQRPFGVRTELAQAFQIPESRVRVMVPGTGSAYGGKHTGECAIEAARLAKTAGKPVKLVWTREEEFTWAYFRPAGVIDVRSGVRKDGTITAWEFHNFNSGPSGIQTPYDVRNQHIEFHSTKYPLRQGSYRGLAATANHFSRESHMDELAHAAGIDPLAFRYKNLKDERVRAVLEAAAEEFGWGRQKARAGHGFGLACGVEKGGYVATCAEISVADENVKIERVVTAFECGAIVNPDHLKNQVEGAAMMAIGGAMFEAVAFENGKILNAALSRYRVPRFSDMPTIQAVLVNRKDLDSAGAGETPIVALAPAVANAIFNAGGKRIRSMPMNSQDTI
ncbi:MAG: molybdopterin-dependent oxidoreductase [Acidobacteriota bacterium]|nr:molybdopterin-dependent oxidoreductase [Acidobacteriota bacterium]